MQKAKMWFASIFVIVAITAICYGISVGGKMAFAYIMALDEKLAAAVIAACATIFVSVITVVYNQRTNKIREIAESHRPEKIKIYKQFMDKAVVGLLRSSKDERINTEQFQKELEDIFFNFTGDVMVWGSPGVIKAYRAFRACGEGDQHILLRLDEMLREIRKDLGNSNWGLNRGELLSLFLTDPESLQNLVEGQEAT